MNRIYAAASVVALLLMLSLSMLFIVDQRSYAIVSSVGAAQRFIVSPGVHFKWPWPLSTVALLDKRIQTIAPPDAQRMLSADKKDVRAKLFIKWRITDPRRYFSYFGNNTPRAQQRLLQRARTAFSAFVAQRSVEILAADNHDALMHAIREQGADEVGLLGVDIVDVRITSLDFSQEHSDSVYSRMATERKQAAVQLRLTGALESAQIRAAADRQREEILAQAYKQAQIVQGEGDAQAGAIYAQAFGRDPQFYRFYKSLNAYRQSFNERDVIVVDPSSDFFRFMHRSNGALNGKH